MRWIFALFGYLLLAFSPPYPTGWQVLFRDDFQDGNAADWTLGNQAGGGYWSVEEEAGNRFLSGQGRGWARLGVGFWSDFSFKSKVKLLAGSVHINFRVNNCARYFVPFYSSGLGLERTAPDCTGQTAGTWSETFSIGRWYEVEILAIGGTLKVYVDGSLKLNYTDADPLLAGTIAFESLNDAHVHVDDVEMIGPLEGSGPERFTWVKTGGPIGGLGYDVRMRPDNPDIMFVTDAWSGLNMSLDGGRNWFASNAGITSRTGPSGDSIPVFCVTVDPNNPDIVWLGTQNVRGIYKSLDGGRNWVQKNKGVVEGSGISFRGISVHPRDSRIVYAAAEISSTAWAAEPSWGREFDKTKGVVYRTTDGGDNWTAIWRGDNLARYVLINPKNPDILYVSTGIFDREAANSDLLHGVPGGVGVLKSADGGRTWRVLNESNGLSHLYIGSLFMHPENPDILLAGAGLIGHPDPGGVFLSSDGGEHWDRVLQQGGQVVKQHISSVEFSTSNPKIAYAASSVAFFRSEDGGRNWRTMSGPPVNGFYGPPGIRPGQPIDLQVDPRDPNRVFANNYGGGNFLSEDGGATWRVASKGYTGAFVNGIAVSPHDYRRVYVIGSGPFRSDDGGENWHGIDYTPFELPAAETVAVSPDLPGRVLISDMNQGAILRSSDAGRTWDVVFRHPAVVTAPNNRHGFKAISFASSNPRVVYAGIRREGPLPLIGAEDPSFGVYKSTDGGETWQEANDANTARANVNAVAIDYRNADIVYVGTRGGVLQTADGGKSWRTRNQGFRALDVQALAIDPRDWRTLYAGFEDGGVYKSSDAGEHWQMSSAGMDPQASIRAIVVDPVSPGAVYAADRRSGVYRSDDGGKVWYAINRGLRTRAVSSLAISYDGTTLYAATGGEGVFRLDLQKPAESAVACVSAASFAPEAVAAPNSIVSLFGQALATVTQTANSIPLPTELGGSSISITDDTGVDHYAPLFFASPSQINILVPAAARKGPAILRVLQQGRVVARGQVRIESVAPGLFTANASGSGVPAAVALRVSGSTQTQIPVFQCGSTAGSCVTAPIDLGPETDQIFLLLFGTGIRGGANASIKIGGVDAEVAYAGAQGGFVGLDQVNVKLPRALAGRGEVDLVLTVEGKPANTVRVRIK